MKTQFKYLSIAMLIITGINGFAQTTNQLDLTQYVDPLWAADKHVWLGGHTFTGACVPYGMVKLGPDCNQKTTNSGYDNEGKIQGFSHVHVSGSGGNPKYGNVLVMATTGEVKTKNFGSMRKNELPTPGLFSVNYADYDIDAKFSATHSVGFHSYTFNKAGNANILFDLGSMLVWGNDTHWTQKLVGSEVRILSDREMQGYTRVRKGWGGGDAYTVFFYAIADTPCFKSGTWKSNNIHAGSQAEPDTNEPVGGFFNYNVTSGQTIRLKVGISFLGVEKAKQNLSKELNHWDFNKTVADSRSLWNKELNKIQITTNNDTTKKIFYSALYHTMHQPVNRTGENPKWKSDKPYYDDFFCIWDTYRVTHPLVTLINESKQVDIMNALTDIYENEGYMPDAWSGNSYAMTQGGSNADVLVADAFAKGLKGIDYEKCLQSMIKNATVPPGEYEKKQGRGGLPDYNTLGYVSTNYERSGSRTMEFAFNDYCIAQVAKGLNKNDVAEKYFKQANNWKNIWCSDIEAFGAKGFVMPRDKHGRFDKTMNLNKIGGIDGWTYEGNAWGYSFFVPHDVNEVLKYMGGAEKFEQRLDTFFTKTGRTGHPFLNDYFNINNEPDFMTPLYYNFIGKPWKTAEIIRKTIRLNYSLGLKGVTGNEDSGSMSGWYVFNTMGFYPVAGTDVYLIGTPSVSTVLTMENGKQIVIKTILPKKLKKGEEAMYIQSCKLNGQLYNKTWFRHSDIANGAVLEFVMGVKPSKWAVGGELPPSMSDNIK
jgi:predicted alpha-1,2-mannosidase